MIIFDLETTGSNILTDRIVELDMKKVNSTFNITDRLYYLLNPEMPIPASSTAIHEITNAEVANCKTFKEIAQEILKFLEGEEYISGYNIIKFDGFLLDAEFKRAGIPFDIFKFKAIDWLKVWRVNEPKTLEGAVKRFLHREHAGAHGASGDVDAVIDLCEPMIQEFELENDLKKLSEEYGFPKEFCGGKMVRDANGDLIMKFGTKYMNKKVKDTTWSDLNWLLNVASIDGELKYFIAKECARLGIKI